MTPIIFLDCDGVIALKQLRRTAGIAAPRPGLRGIYTPQVRAVTVRTREINAAAVSFLNVLCQRTRAQLVVSSSWRLQGDCRLLLIEHGVADQFHSVWKTDADGPKRGDEIERWLIAHGRPPHVILDDWAGELEQHHGRLVRTDYRSGLTGDDVERAVAIIRTERERFARNQVTV